MSCALRFFYGITLGQKEAFERIVAGKEPQKLPPVLSPEEIVRFLTAVKGLRNRVALTTAYAAGLRVGEVVQLKIARFTQLVGLTRARGQWRIRRRRISISRLSDRRRVGPAAW